MTPRRAVPAGLGGLGVATGGSATGACRSAIAAAVAGLARRSGVIRTDVGPPEHAVAGARPPLMMIHGSGGDFGQELLFAHELRESDLRIVAPSRVRYLRSALPEDASPVQQADVLVALLNAPGIWHLPVIGPDPCAS